MLHRYAAATSVASSVAALATLVVLLVPQLHPTRTYPLLAVWCVMPAVWGVWAMLTPERWMPRRLPAWGAILGLLAGTVVMFGLNLPLRMFGVATSVAQRGVAVLVLGGVYYVFWRVVRFGFDVLAGKASARVP